MNRSYQRHSLTKFAGLLLVTACMTLTSCRSWYHASMFEAPSCVLDAALEEGSEDPLFACVNSIPEDWWWLFQDCQLADLIETALVNNPTVQAAQSRILAAQAKADQLRVVPYPYVNWTGDTTKFYLSETSIIPVGNNNNSGIPLVNGPNIPQQFVQYESSLSFMYELDVWSKRINIWRSAMGEVHARLADAAFARLAISVSVAQVYYRLQMDYARCRIAKKIVAIQQDNVRFTEQRILANLDSEIDLQTMQNNLAMAERALLQIEGDIAVTEHQLQAYLAGDFAENVCEIKLAEMPLPRAPLPMDLPLNLIAHRPDIISQLWLLESAGRQIQVAKAGFYPNINLTAFAGFQTINLSQFFLPKSGDGNLEAAFSLPIFDSGRLQANLIGARVDYDLAIYQYNDSVINATKEVLDALSIVRNSHQLLEQYAQSTALQEEIQRLNRLRETHNLNSALQQLGIDQQVLLAQDQEILAKANTITAILTLIKALGGGYTACILDVEGAAYNNSLNPIHLEDVRDIDLNPYPT